MNSPSLRLVSLGTAIAAWLVFPLCEETAAQPAASFRSSCSGLREAVSKLPDDETLRVIEVVGRLTHVQEGAGLVYLLVCSPPDPQVLCVTYSAGGRKAGDAVMVAGSYSQRGPDHILLDPCLPAPPEE